MMISQFWNLCRACPALDVDKVSSKCQYLIAAFVGRDVTLRVIQTIEFRVWDGLTESKDGLENLKRIFFSHKSEGTFWIPFHV